MSKSTIKLLVFALAIGFIPISGLSQEVDSLASITGVVEVIEDSTNLFFSPPNVIKDYPHALPSTNITLLRSDSTVVTGTSSGHKKEQYKIKDIKPGNYIIKAMYVGYESQLYSIHLDHGEKLEKDIVLGHIYSSEKLTFGSSEAKEDIRNGIVEIRTLPTVGCCFMCDEEIIEKREELAKQLRKKYGFTKRNVADEFEEEYKENWEKLRQAIIRYNTTVKNYIAQKNGANWEKRYEKELRKAEKKLLKESKN